MTPPQGMAEFFAMEANEYLTRLDVLVSAGGTPDATEFVRLARALRGSALMANQQPIAASAGGLEAFARALKDTRLTWDAANKQIGIRAVDDLKIFVRALPQWGPAEDAKALALAQELERLAGGGRTPGKPAPRTPDAGTRALVAREGAALASELDRLSASLAQNPAAPGQAVTALRVMQPLRGVAGLADLPPLPDILEGVERAVGEVTRRPETATAAAALFRAAAKALARAAKEAAAGPVATDTPELADFALRLRDLVEPAGGTVPIESLYFNDGQPDVVHAGTAPVRPGAISRVALVSHGEHLKQVSDGLQRATSPAQRDLRAQSLTPTLRHLAAGGGALSAFASAAHDAVARAASLPDPTALVTALRDAGTLLAHAASAQDPGLGEALTRIATTLTTKTAQPVRAATQALVAAPPPAPAQAPMPAPVQAPAAAPVAPIAAAAPRRSGSVTAPVMEESGDIVGSFLRLARYNSTLGPGTASIDELIAGPPALGAPAAVPAGVAAGQTISMNDLRYSGPAALERAVALQADVRAALRPGGNAGKLPDLLEEVFDLVKLGIQRGG